ncbi:MAG: HAMP domain-containing histidine kinase [Bacteroidetes bacterium]|nr:HAMP domain-containing histidine kinase [Bacteroidota bacterium]
MKLISLYNRILLPVLIVVFSISIVVSYFFIRKVLQNELDATLSRTKRRIVNYVAANQSLPAINSFNDQKIIFEPISSPLKDTGFYSATQYIPEQQKEHISRKLLFQLNNNGQLYKVTISEPLEGTSHLTILLAKIACITIFLTLLILLVINRNILKRIWQPFYQSLEAIKSFNVHSRQLPALAVTHIDEFKMMNSHFNSAAENAVKDYKHLKEFSENASHEIQTPLAIIHSKLDLLVQQDDLTEAQSELLQSAFASVKKLSNLQQSLLLLTKIDNGQYHKTGQLQLDAVIKNKMDDFQDIFNTKGITTRVELEETSVTANRELLDILLNNLFSNAVKHNFQGGVAGISLKDKRLTVCNTGNSNVLDENRLFRRFYKAVQRGESNGLGLSIIKEICQASGSTITYAYHDGMHCFSVQW